MKRKNILILLIVMTLVLTLLFTLAACGNKTCEHSEPNAEGRCDKCGEVIGDPYTPPTDYDIDSVTIAGNDLGSYVFAINEGDIHAQEVINNVRDSISRATGITLGTVYINKLHKDQRAVYIELIANGSERSTKDGYRIYVEEDGDLHIEGEFPEKFVPAATDFFVKNIVESKISNVKLDTGTIEAADHRNLYYKDYGAVGDGETDDYAAIKACHDYANLWGHTVNAEPGATYYFDCTEGFESVEIKSDTYWRGCSFIFDGSRITEGSAGIESPIFAVRSDVSPATYTGSKLAFTALKSNAKNLGGWKPGTKALVYICSPDIKQYIRYGTDELSAQDLQEVILVDEKGNIDPSTPVQWDYVNISSITVCPVSDRAIVISGGEDGERCSIRTLVNTASEKYQDNILITRSNVLFSNTDFSVTDTDGLSYQGVYRIERCTGTTAEGLWLTALPSRNSSETYNIISSYTNALTLLNCKENCFFNEDGTTHSAETLSMTYCKNTTLNDVRISVIHAVRGVYNLAVTGSDIQNIITIGEGLLKIDNTNIYPAEGRAIIELEKDGGASWQGDVVLNSVDVKYNTSLGTSNIYLIDGHWLNFYFGYNTYLPKNIVLNNVRTLGCEFSVLDVERTENVIETNVKELCLFTDGVLQYSEFNISDPEKDCGERFGVCICECSLFNDIDANGRCNNRTDNDGKWCGGYKDEEAIPQNLNPYTGTKSVTVVNTDPKNPLTVIYPATPQFKDMSVTVDGIEK